MKRKISISSGREEADVAEFVAQKADESPPCIAWAEPEPTAMNNGKPGRWADFQALVLGKPQWPEGLPLVEARLFWPDSALHVVAHEKGCRWVRVEETADEGEEVTRKDIAVLTLRDWKRFGLSDALDIENLTAIEYRKDGRLIAWRLLHIA